MTIFQHKNPKSGNKNGTQGANKRRGEEIAPVLMQMLELDKEFGDEVLPIAVSTSSVAAFIRNPDADLGFCGADGKTPLTGPMLYIREIKPDRRARTPARLVVYIMEREDLHNASKTATSLPWDQMKELAKNSPPSVVLSKDVQAKLEKANA